MKTIAISAGHAPNIEKGATAFGLYEEIINLHIAEDVSEILRRHSVPTLEVPHDLTLVQTIEWINERNTQIDICLEIHCNAGGGSGVEAWYYQNLVTKADDLESKKLAQFVTDAIAVETGWKNRGVKGETTNLHGKLGFIHDTKPLAALVECGFIDNPLDAEKYKTEEGIFQIAKGVARGLLGYIGVTWNPELLSTPSPTPPTTDLDLHKKIDELNEKVVGLVNEVKSLQDKQSGFNLAIDNVKKDTEELYKDRDIITTIKENTTAIEGRLESSIAKQTTIETNLKQALRTLGDETATKYDELVKRVKVLEGSVVASQGISILAKFGQLFIGRIKK
jgi:hypothetical protein